MMMKYLYCLLGLSAVGLPEFSRRLRRHWAARNSIQKKLMSIKHVSLNNEEHIKVLYNFSEGYVRLQILNRWFESCRPQNPLSKSKESRKPQLGNSNFPVLFEHVKLDQDRSSYPIGQQLARMNRVWHVYLIGTIA